MSTGEADDVELSTTPLFAAEVPWSRERRAARVKRRDGVDEGADAAAPLLTPRGWPESTVDRSEREVFDAFFHGAVVARRRLGYAPATWSTNARSEAQ
jgi:hypothetical protein